MPDSAVVDLVLIDHLPDALPMYHMVINDGDAFSCVNELPNLASLLTISKNIMIILSLIRLVGCRFGNGNASCRP